MIRVSRLLARIIKAIIAVSNRSEPTTRMTASAAVMRWSVFPVCSCGMRNRVLAFARRQFSFDGKGLATAALILGYLQLAATVGVVLVAAILVAAGAQ